MKHYLNVKGHIISECAAYVRGRRTDYELLVEVGESKQHEESLLDFFLYHDDSDFRKYPQNRYEVLNEINCARMWATKHFGEHHLRFKVDGQIKHTSGPSTLEPVAANSDWKIWVLAKTETEIVTDKNAAWELYERCAHGKLDVESARRMLQERFPTQHFDWHQVLSAFNRLGGRHTDKYLRRE